jgi:hypothetical protein
MPRKNKVAFAARKRAAEKLHKDQRVRKKTARLARRDARLQEAA